MRGRAGRRRILLLLGSLIAGTLGLPGPLEASERAHPVREATLSLGRAGAASALPFRANLVGVSLPSGAWERDLQLRVRSSGSWGPWQSLRFEEEEGPEGGERARAVPRAFSEPVWVGLGEAIAVRERAGGALRTPGDARVHLLNVRGDATPPSLLGRIGGAIRGLLTSRPALRAEASVARPAIISRARWGPSPLVPEEAPGYGDVQMAFVHHTVNSNAYARSDSFALVRGIHRYHTRTRGWRDIGYNFLIDRYGQIFEGRHGGKDRSVWGAHVLGFNKVSTGISLIGDFRTARPTTAMLSALQRLLAWKLDVHHVPPTGRVRVKAGEGADKYRPGTYAWLNRISGHRDGQHTTCPGAETYKRLGSVRSAVDRTGHPKIYLPRTTGTILRPDGDGSRDTFTVRATLSRTAAWSLHFLDRSTAAVKTFTGEGTAVEATWDAVGTDGLPVATGRYSWSLQAQDAAGASAIPATGVVYVVTDHPDGTVLASEDRMIVRTAGTAKALPLLAWETTYPYGERIPTGAGEIDALAQDPVETTLRDGAILRVPDGSGDFSYYVAKSGLRREMSAATFAALGYTPEAAIEITPAERDAIPAGPALTDATVHPDGTAIADPADPTRFWRIQSGTRVPMSRVALLSRYRVPQEVLEATAGDLTYPEASGGAVTVRDGTIIRSAGGSYWTIAGGLLRRFYNTTLMKVMGYPFDESNKAAWRVEVFGAELSGITKGPDIG